MITRATSKRQTTSAASVNPSQGGRSPRPPEDQQNVVQFTRHPGSALERRYFRTRSDARWYARRLTAFGIPVGVYSARVVWMELSS